METMDATTGKRKRGPMARIDARISRRLKDKVEQAAFLRDQSVTDFLAGALDEAASKVIMEETTIQLHFEDQRKLAEVLIADEPFPPVEKMTRLRQAAINYDAMVERK